MIKNERIEDFPKLTVYLPPELEKEIYADFVTLASKAVTQATENVTVNNRYLNQKQLMEYMQVGVGRIREWEVMGLKFFMNGRSKMYDMKDIEKFFEDLKI